VPVSFVKFVKITNLTCPHQQDYSKGTSHGLCNALREAFETTDADFLSQGLSASGTCALVSCVSGSTLVTANAGDCRGIICTGGQNRRVERLSEDHKPNREDEKARIRSAGGDVEFFGCWRVKSGMGPILLAVSRALGDRHFKTRRPHIVTAEPDLTTREIKAGHDHYLVLACDGVWDVFSDEEASGVVGQAIQRCLIGIEKMSSTQTVADVAATALVTEAFDKGSADNISVIVIRILAPQTPGDVPDPNQVTDCQ